MHPYHTKVPYAAIKHYIKHYTKAGDLVYDGFCGTGMTGVAAQLCKEDVFGEIKDGARKAILSDLSPEATFISNAYNQPYSLSEVTQEAEQLISECLTKYGWMYKTKTSEGYDVTIDSCVWSDVLICPKCGHEFIFWNEAVDIENGKIPTVFKCKNCGASLKKKDCKHALDIFYDNTINESVTMFKQVPVLIGYSGAKKGNKSPDPEDLATIRKIDEQKLECFVPTNIIPHGEKTEEAIARGITRSYQFYFKRSLFFLGYLWEKGSLRIKAIVSKMLFRMTKRYALTYQSGTWGAGGGPTPGTLYIPSLVKELNIINQFRDAVRDFSNAYEEYDVGQTIITTQSSTSVPQISENSIDYIFTDPPFGSNIMYSELNFLWESWLKVLTNESEEAIVSQQHGKNLSDYQRLMTRCFRENYRILKPGRWTTIEFHNSQK
jgi:predicted RNA methylase/transcription elongation factor Elf1